MKIVVTGGTGFIGKWFLASIPEDYECIILGRSSDKSSLFINNRLFKYISTDYSQEDLEQKLKGIDAVVHLAATRVGSDKFDSYISNMIVSENIFRGCAENGVTNIVCLSSISIYSDINLYPWSEEQMLSPQSFYGISKVTMENLAGYYNQKYNMNIKSLRVAQVVGYGERTGYMLMTFIKQAFKRECLSIYGNGAGRREYIYVRDVVEAILCSLRKPNITGVYNIGNGKNISHLELAEMINTVFDNERNLKFIDDIKEDTSIFLMDISKAKESLGWLPKWTIKEGLKEIRNIMIHNSDM